MPGHRVPIIYKGNGDWINQFQKDLEKALSGITLHASDPHTVQADEDVIIVCPSYSRLEADLDHAFQGIRGARHTERQRIVLYIHNVTEQQLSVLNTQRDVQSDLADKYSGIHVIDIGVSNNRIYQCQRNKDSIKKLSGILKPKNSSWSMGNIRSMIPANPFSSTKTPEEKRAVPNSADVDSSVSSATMATPDKSPILNKPWRDIRWDTNYVRELQTDIQRMVMPEYKPTTNILVLGERGSGKKSFGRFVADALNCPFVDNRKDSWIVKSKVNNFRLVGAEELPSVPINEWMQSVLPPAELEPPCVADSRDGAGSDTALGANTVSCVVIVASAKNIWDNLHEALQWHLEDIRKLGIPRILILTHTEVCPVVEKQIRHMYLSRWMKDIIERGAELYQMPVSNVHAVKSYSKGGPESTGPLREESESTVKRILLLRALLQTVQFTSDYICQTMNA